MSVLGFCLFNRYRQNFCLFVSLSGLLEKESSSELKEKPNALKMDVKLDIINARMNMATSKENRLEAILSKHY